MNVQQKPDLTEARRLLAKGFKLCKLQPNSKQPVGREWNLHPVKAIDDDATGYGVPLKANGLCSIDPDRVDDARTILHALGFDLDQLMEAGVRSASTRPGSGGRAAFKAPATASGAPGVRWITFSFAGLGTVLELRAESPNLQDVLPGLTYTDKAGNSCTQQYVNDRRLDEAPELPQAFRVWWQRLSTDLDFLREQQRKAGAALGVKAFEAVSGGATGQNLAFASHLRPWFNEGHTVPDVLSAHGYTEPLPGRYAPPTATGAPGVRQIPGKDDLWQSNHASDPLRGTFDAWAAFVVLEHGGDLAAAEEAAGEERNDETVDDFADLAATAQEAVGSIAAVAPIVGKAATLAMIGQAPELQDAGTLPEAEREALVEILKSGGTLSDAEARQALRIGPTDRRHRLDLSGLRPTEFAVDGFLRNGLTVIAGAPGVGKTSLIVPLAAVVAHLVESPMRPALRRGVVYLSEDPEQVETVLYALAKHAPGAASADEFNQWFTLLPSRRLTPEKLAKLIASIVETHTVDQNGYPVRPLIVLDTSNANLEIESENDNAEVGRAIAAIKQNLSTAACWLIAHTPKTLKRADVRDMTTRGASAFAGDANATAFVFQEDGQDDRRFLALDKHRFEADFREIEFTTECGEEVVQTPWGDVQRRRYRWGLPAVGNTAARIEARERAREQAREIADQHAEAELQGAIVRFVASNGPSSKNDIAAGVAGKTDRKRKAVDSLLDSGALVVTGRKNGGDLLAVAPAFFPDEGADGLH